jgi:hypothetical protein
MERKAKRKKSFNFDLNFGFIKFKGEPQVQKLYNKAALNNLVFIHNTLRPIYTWVRFRIRLAHFPKYKNNYILKNGLAYCEIALWNRTCKQAFIFFLIYK